MTVGWDVASVEQIGDVLLRAVLLTSGESELRRQGPVLLPEADTA
jgi:hypothetical protein